MLTTPFDVRRFIAVYDEVLPPALCQRLVENFLAAAPHQVRNREGVREGMEASSYTELNVSGLAEPDLHRGFEITLLKHFDLYNAQLGLSRPVTPVKRISDLIMKHYQVSQHDRFQIHFDAIHQHANRYLVFLWYLNTGGETWFPDLELKIAPKAGRLLIFPPYWMFQHAGLAPLSEDKYIISTYAIF